MQAAANLRFQSEILELRSKSMIRTKTANSTWWSREKPHYLTNCSRNDRLGVTKQRSTQGRTWILVWLSCATRRAVLPCYLKSKRKSNVRTKKSLRSSWILSHLCRRKNAKLSTSTTLNWVANKRTQTLKRKKRRQKKRQSPSPSHSRQRAKGVINLSNVVGLAVLTTLSLR